ncbi:MAG: hypothetical protein ACP5N0_01275 [Methanosarcina sp.]|uniref:hypothetical protein n=1 Tax=Methanosarcina sp. TaxID=2213 RepID=UPI003BB7F521
MDDSQDEIRTNYYQNIVIQRSRAWQDRQAFGITGLKVRSGICSVRNSTTKDSKPSRNLVTWVKRFGNEIIASNQETE